MIKTGREHDENAKQASRRDFLRQLLAAGAAVPLAGALPALALPDQPKPLNLSRLTTNF